MQLHHFATNKNKAFTPIFEKIVSQYGLKLDEAWNKAIMPHLGRHPNKYHEFVVEGMRRAAREAGNNVDDFIKNYNKYVVEPVKNNAEILRKSFWE